MSDIHYLMAQAMEDRGHSFDICWNQPGSTLDYVLSVQASARGGDANWKMFEGLSQDSQPLWTYISCDVLLVFNLVTSTSSDEARKQKQTQQNQQLEQHDGPRPYPNRIADLVRRDVTSTQGSPVFDGSTGKKKSQALAGDLSLVQIPTLLQSILMAKMTGVLKVEDPDGKGLSQVFFQDGAAVHCVATDSIGEEGILELLCWKEGSFHFDAQETNDVRTIKHSLESLLLQGMTLIDNSAYISNLGVSLESVLQKNHHELSDEDFEAHCKKGAPVNMQKQKTLYREINSEAQLGAILEKYKWPRSQWVPVLCNLLRTDLVSAAPVIIEEPQIVLMEPKRIDKLLIQEVMMSLRNPITGLFNYSAFLYFVEQEYFRAYRSSNPLSIVIFQMRTKGPGPDAPREPLPLIAVSAAVRRISSLKRHVDMLAHYESHDFVALLPNTKAAGAEVFANRVIKALTAEALVPVTVTPQNFEAAFGIACIPEDFLDLSQVLSAAEIAKSAAATGPEPIVLFRDIKHRYAFAGAPAVPPQQ